MRSSDIARRVPAAEASAQAWSSRMVVAVAVLFALRTAGVISNWWFGILAVVVVFAAPGRR